mgnify:CR=1 FL=1
MYSRDVMAKKREKFLFFSVVTKTSTHGDTLKHWASTFLTHYLNVEHHKDDEYVFQIAIAIVNKGHIVDFPIFLTEEKTFFQPKISYKKFRYLSQIHSGGKLKLMVHCIWLSYSIKGNSTHSCRI